MAKNQDGYLSAKESRRISKENRRITDQYEKRRKRRNVPESEYTTQMKDPANAVEFDNLHTYFFTDTGVVKSVDGVSFEVPIGKTVGVVGESGCGKSVTSLSLMQLLQRPQGQIVEGAIRLNLGNDKAYDIAKTPADKMQSLRGNYISMIFQEPMTALNPVLRIRSQMYEAFEGEKLSKEEKRRRAIELLKLVGIPSPETRLDEYPHQFSGGMRQRAMIAIALGARPKLLLADEPTTALDVTIQDQIMKLLNQLKQELGMSIILVTHDLGVIAQMCDRVAVMYAGQIVEMTDTVTLFSRPRHPYTYGLMGSLPNEETAGTTLEAIKGSPPNLAHLPEGCPFSPRCKYACDLCRRERPALTEVEPGHLARCHRLDVTASFQGLIEVPDGAGRKEDTPHG